MKLKLKIIDLDGVYFEKEVDLLNVTKTKNRCINRWYKSTKR